MADFPALSLGEVTEALSAVKRPLVLMHVRPDGDTVGTAGALLEIFRELGKTPVYLSSDEIPERLAFLLEGYEKAEELSGLTPIAVDVSSPSQLGELYERLTVYLTVDHHAVNTPFSPHYTLDEASSAGEVMWEIAEELNKQGKIKITRRMAECLYAAISSDTGGFLYSNASKNTYLTASRLVGYGIDHADINRRLFFSKTKEAIRAEGFVGSRLMTDTSGKIAYAVVSKEERNSLGLAFADFETAIDVVRSLLGAVVSFVVKETDKGEFKASLRSAGADVAEIAKRHSGGGHIRAAGCTVKADSADEAAKILLAELTQIL